MRCPGWLRRAQHSVYRRPFFRRERHQDQGRYLLRVGCAAEDWRFSRTKNMGIMTTERGMTRFAIIPSSTLPLPRAASDAQNRTMPLHQRQS